MRVMLAVMLLASTLPLSAEEPPAVPQAVAALQHLKPQPNNGPSAWTAGPYHYDGAGNIDRIGPESFVYDKIGRVKSATVRGPDLSTLQTQTYTYDPYGNLIETRKLGQIVNLSVTANRLNAATYDASGNVTISGTNRYGYDAVGMMNTIHAGASLQPRVIYAYTADDERLFAFDTATNTTHWTLRGFDNKVLRDFRQNGSTWSVERDYVYRDGLLLAAIKPNNAVEHYTLDHLGSPRLITDAAGHKIGYHVYWPFGEEWTPGNAQEGAPLKFTGHERDTDPAGGTSPLDSMHARYYRAEWGRFLATDPILGETAAPQSWNLYAYTRNDPVSNVDLDGQGLRSAVGKIVEIAADKVTLKVLKRGATKAEMKAAAAAGEDVLVGSRSAAKDIAKELGEGAVPMHHASKNGQRGHYHVAGHPSGYGHIFYGMLAFLPYVGWVFDVDDAGNHGDADPLINARARQLYGADYYDLTVQQRRELFRIVTPDEDERAKSGKGYPGPEGWCWNCGQGLPGSTVPSGGGNE